MKKQFNAFDKVLVRIDGIWYCSFYCHYNSLSKWHFVITGNSIQDKDILPYEGNEHLIGTTDSPDEEVKLEKGEWIIASDSIYKIEIGYGNTGRFVKIENGMFLKSAFEEYGIEYRYALRFSDFNPNDMEETRRHILYVKNGKVVKYKQ